MSQIGQSSRLEHRSNEGDVLPQKEEWALIYKQKANQYERLKKLEKQRDREKKNAFKRELDNQIYSKNDVHKQEKDEDRRYYQFISKKAEEMKQKEEQARLEKFKKRQFVEQENKHFLNISHQRSLSANMRPLDHSFDIGGKSERQKKIREEIAKRNMIDTLDQQLHQKEQQQRQEKLQNMLMEQRNNFIQEEYFKNRGRGSKSYGQNLNVYKHYQDLSMDRMRRERQLDHRLVDEAAMRKAQEQYRRRQSENKKKHELMNNVKETLDEQVKIHNYRKAEEQRVNPEDNNYSVIGSMFKERPSPYDKRQYSEYLRRQAEQQRRKKIVFNHMSEQQYKLNLNQLNKAVNGQYAHDHYEDRSLTNIGEKDAKMNYNMVSTAAKDEDADLVRQKLENIIQRKRGYNDEASSIF